MAVYRHVHINYWQDGFVLDLTPEEKYFYIYLMTNSKTSQCGIYEIPKKIIETETGYNRETVEKLIKRFIEYKKIDYYEETKEIFIKNWVKHNKLNSPMVKKCIEKELLNVKNTKYINMFLEECEKYGYTLSTSVIPGRDNNENMEYEKKNIAKTDTDKQTSKENRGENNEGSKCKHREPKHATASKKEDDDIYRKPTEEELREFEREINRKNLK